MPLFSALHLCMHCDFGDTASSKFFVELTCIDLCSAQFTFFELIVFMFCKHKYINNPPPHTHTQLLSLPSPCMMYS